MLEIQIDNTSTNLTMSSDDNFRKRKKWWWILHLREPVKRVDYIVCAFSISFFLALLYASPSSASANILSSSCLDCLIHSMIIELSIHPSIHPSLYTQRWILPQTRIKNYLSSGRYIYRESEWVSEWQQ